MKRREIEIEYVSPNGKKQTFKFTQKELEAIFAAFHQMVVLDTEIALVKAVRGI